MSLMMMLKVLLPLLSIVSMTRAQCDLLPDGTSCDGFDFQQFADPNDCSSYFECQNGCAVNLKCEYDFLFDTMYSYCYYPLGVDCGARPCLDPTHCNTATTTPIPTLDCGHQLDCTDRPYGFYEDPWNCRKYWECNNGVGTHHICDDDMLFDPFNIWCEWLDLEDCGDRPICDVCDQNCYSIIPVPPTLDCGHQLDCTTRPDGWYADPWNCRKYWECDNGVGSHGICGDNTLFDPFHVWCDYSDHVTCGDRPVCDVCDENCTA